MLSKLQFFLYASLLASATAQADIPCDSTLSASIHQTQRVVDSIRVDKPGLARVYAANGSEFTAGQALWMKARMREVEATCARGADDTAAQRLAPIQALLTAHSR